MIDQKETRIAGDFFEGFNNKLIALSATFNLSQAQEQMLELPYSGTELPLSCEVSASTADVFVSTSCTCTEGVCTVGVTSAAAFYGNASLVFSLSSGSISSSAQINLNIDFVCPLNWTKVPANSFFGINNDFCVMTYEAKNDGAYNAISHPDAPPWVYISANDAKTKCTSLGTNYDLISNPEWMTIAHNIENVAENWTGGSVGSGCLMRGNVGGDVACTGVNSGYNGADPDYGTSRSDNGTATLTLSNGEEIWDFSGNVWEFTDWIPGGSLDLGPITCPDNIWEELPSIGDCSGQLAFIDFYPSNPAGVPGSEYDSTYGLGVFRGGSGGVAIRGARWDFSDSGGIYALNLSYNATYSNEGIGFRCVWRP